MIDLVANLAHTDRDQAERTAQAVLTTLAERISAGEARDLAEQLPAPLSGWLHTTTGPEPFGYDEFLRRVAAREGTDLATAERHARAVFAALARAVDGDELDDLAAELPHDFGPLVAEARRTFFHRVDASTFLANVAERAAIGTDAARKVTDAVLETLAERISTGEVEDLEAVLPLEFRPALERGKRGPQKLDLDDFLNRVAKRLHVTPLQTRRFVEAVFLTLRETIPREEFLDVTAQLPYEYASVGARPHPA
jgi:uncharacterized protein (DUF2267 family)